MSINALVTNTREAQPILPVAHQTRFATFESFLNGPHLPLNSTCPRNGRPATYFFYGVPFYRLPHPRKAPYELDVDDVDEYAVGLLLPPMSMAGIAAEVFPFDTGGLANGHYVPVMDRATIDLDDFVVSTSEACLVAAKLVSLIFGDNLTYVTGRHLPYGSGGSSGNRQLDQLLALYRAKIKADSRRRGIEVIALAEVPWDNTKVVVIGPRYELQRRRGTSKALARLLDSSETTLLSYEDMIPFSPTSDSRVVLDLAIKWLSQQGFLGTMP